jgi:peptidoglycan/LPS O-acetylase OafA/YrhL
MGYMGSAIAVFVCFFIMMIMSYFWGRKYYPVPYNLKRIGTYFLLAVIIYFVSVVASKQPPFFKFSLHTILLSVFIFSVIKLEKNELKRLFKFNQKK